MKVWQKQTVRYLDKSGKQVRKGDQEAKPKTVYSKRFYGTLRTADRKRKQVPLTENEKSSQQLLSKMQTEVERNTILGISPDYETGQMDMGQRTCRFAKICGRQSFR